MVAGKRTGRGGVATATTAIFFSAIISLGASGSAHAGKPPASGTSNVACPTGATFDASLGFCADTSYAYGPFTQAMTTSCINGGGGAVCSATASYTVGPVTLSLQRWTLASARSYRGRGACPAGALASAAHDGLCVETVGSARHVYAGMAPEIVNRCQQLGGGADCYLTRYEAGSYLRYSFAHILQGKLTAAWTGTGIPTVSVTVSTPDQGNVYASTSTGTAIAPATARYRFASVTKHLTAALVLRLQEAGYLHIDDPLAAHLPVAGLANGGTITIRQLLNHSAGVGDYLNYSTSFLNSTSTWRTYTNQDIVGYINEVGAKFAPGTGYSYSNGNFYLLGMLIEKKLGVSLTTAFHTWIFQPLGLTQTVFDETSSPTQKVPNLVESTRAYAYSTTSVRAAGALVSTTADMAAFERALHTGSFLTPASLTALKAPSARNSSYGLGTILFSSDAGTPYYGHTGTLLNYKSLVYFVPAMNVGVAFTMNAYPADRDLANIRAAIYSTVESRYLQ
jgi:CubicO group peptidase (beta-lactamase class C family)